jgi:hypothetical protein
MHADFQAFAALREFGREILNAQFRARRELRELRDVTHSTHWNVPKERRLEIAKPPVVQHSPYWQT